MRQLAFQIFDLFAALWRVQGAQDFEELRTIAILCGAGFDASLLCLCNGLM